MNLRPLSAFVFQAISVGLAVAFLVVVWNPELLRTGRPVVSVVESPPLQAGVTPQSGPVSYAAAVERAAPAVVNIYTKKLVSSNGYTFLDDPVFRHFFGDQFQPPPRQRLETSLGSGVIVSEGGYILTNNHVVAEADEIEVALADGRTAAAKVIGTDPEADIAVLKVELAGLPVIILGSAEGLKVGDVVLAIGNPFGVGQTVTLGIVSATGRNQLGINTFENFIQTDAAINPGNSGGALITARGDLLGINTAIFSRTGGSQGIGFAIPVNLAKDVMTQIIETGHVVRGWLGIEVQEVSHDLAESFDLPNRDGVIVAGVLRGGPAAEAGLQPGDVITSIGDQPVHDVRSALDLISRTQPGSILAVTALRSGSPIRLGVKVAERPMQEARSGR